MLELPPGVTFLNFSYNRALISHDDFFMNVTDIEHLELGSNRLKFISHGAFLPLKKLQRLNLGLNPLTYETLAPALSVKTLIKLVLIGLGLGPLPDDLFHKYPLSHLEELLLYKMQLQPDTPLHPTFRGRLLDIAAAHTLQEDEQADYMAQLLVRDFGTHVITGVQAGAALLKIDHLSRSFLTEYEGEDFDFRASAGASLFGLLSASMSLGFHFKQDSTQKYDDARTSTQRALGGLRWAGQYAERDSGATNETFGGVYQTCEMTDSENGDLCGSLVQTNPLTGDTSCPPSYRAVPLHQGTARNSRTEHQCHSFLSWKWHCHDVVYQSTASYSIYWCVADQPVPQDSGYLFGGLYTTQVANPVTQRQSCPPSYLALAVGSGLRVCVSDDFVAGADSSVPFGGFFSCTSGNPLAAGVNKGLRERGGGCEINYCTQTPKLHPPKLPSVKRPPFTLEPAAFAPPKDNMVIFDRVSRTWHRDEKASESAKMNGAEEYH
nr:hypothetical protein BaRGS_029379 [Batillaria attramentaria]